MKKNLKKAIVLSVLTMSALGITSSASAADEMLFSDFVKGVESGGTIEVSENTIVTADSVGSGYLAWKDVALSPYKLEVKKGAELVLNDLITYNPQITGEVDIVINKTNVSSTYQEAYGHGIVLTSIKDYLPGMSENVSIKANSLTINVGIEGAPWTAKGIMVPDGERGTVNIELTDKLDIHARSAAIHTEGNTETLINITAKNVEMLSDGDWVIHTETGSSVDIKAQEDIIMKSFAGQGITNNASKGYINFNAKNITIDGHQLYGIAAGSGNVTLTAENDNTIICNDNSSNDRGIQNKNGKVTITSLNGENTIWGGDKGIYAQDAASVDVTAEKGSNTVTGKNVFALGSDKGAITLNAKDNYVYSDRQAMYAHGGRINVKSTGTTKMIGDVVADEYAERAGYAKAGFDSRDSYLLGTVNTDNGTTKNSVTDLSFTDGANWYLTGDSNVSNLTLKNGFVDLTQNEKGNAHKISIDKALNGSGLFKLDLTYHGNYVTYYEKATDSDFIYIHGGDGSEQNIAFVDSVDNLGAMQNGDKLYFAKVAADAASFGQGETITKANESGIYDNTFRIDYEAAAENNLPELVNNNFDGAVALAADTDEANNTEEQSPASAYNNWFITCEKGGINPNGDSPVKSYNAGFALWRDDDTLLKRLGELRYTNDEGGVWTRVIGKKLEDNRSLGFNTHAKTVQVGYDRKDVQKDGSGTWRKGIAVGHTWADTSFGSGEGKNNYTDLSIYATNIRKHDHYWDLVARIGRIDSEYDTVYGDHGEFDNWAGSLSAEYGRKKQMNDDNWFIEPQVQLTYSYMWGDSYTTSKGIRVEQDNADSLVGRAGFVISKELESERKYPNRYYAKAFIMHEFLDGGDNTVCFGSDRFYAGSDFKDTWYVVGIGANADMGNQCTFYFDAEKNFKAHVKMPYRIEVGFRWEF